MKKIFILIFINCLQLYARVDADTSKQYEISFERSDFEYIKDNDGLTHIKPVKQIEYSFSGDTTQPALPLTKVSVWIPQNTEVSDYSFNIKSEQLFSEVIIVPCSPILPSNSTDADVAIKKSHYSEKKYPSVSVGMNPSTTMQGYKYVSFIVCPFLYNAATKGLELITNIKLTIKLKALDHIKSSLPTKKEGQQRVRRLVINPKELDAMAPAKTISQKKIISAAGALTNEKIEYLIVTADSLKRYFLPLISWKTQKGISSKIITMEEINASYTGSTMQLKLKNCLCDFYLNHELKWALLGGDNTIVPVKYCFGQHDPGLPIPTDLFYACYDGCFDWDLNANGLFGESLDGVDLAPEIFISRAPVRNKDNVNTFVNKTLDYEMNPPQANYVERLLLAGNKLSINISDKSDAQILGEKIYREYIYPNWSGNKMKFFDTGTDFSGGASYDFDTLNLQTQLNGGYHLVYMTTHGDPAHYRMETYPKIFYSSSNASRLINSNKFILITNACETNNFDTNDYDPCLSEALFRNPNGGCVAYFGNSWYGFFMPGDTLICNSFAFDAEYFRELFDKSKNQTQYGFAELTTNAKINRIPFSISEPDDIAYNRWIQYSLNAIGDPEMPVYTYNPLHFSNAEIMNNGTSVTISTGGIDSCRIVLTSLDPNNPSIEVADCSASCTFTNITTPYSVTITKHNFVPFVYLTDLIIRDTIIENDLYVKGRNIYIGSSDGSVLIRNGAHLVLDASENCYLGENVECVLGSSIEIIKH